MSKGKKPKHLFNLIYIGVTIVAIALVISLTTDFTAMGKALENFSIWWLISCIAALVLYWLTDALLLHDITRYMYGHRSYLASLKVGLIGLYYCALTPSSTGGQPMQVITMRRDGVPVGTATGIVGVKFVVYEMSLCALYITGMALRGSYYYVHSNEAFWLSILGFVFNLIAVACIVLTLVNEKLVLNLGRGILRFLARIRIIRRLDAKIELFEKTIADYHTAASYIAKHKRRVLGSFIISVFNLGFLLVIPYLIYLAFGFRENNAINIFVMETYLFLAVSFIPLPGAAGASEGGFLLFFGKFFTAVTTVAMLIWRFLTYYMILIVGTLIVVLGEVLSMRRAAKKAQIQAEDQ